MTAQWRGTRLILITLSALVFVAGCSGGSTAAAIPAAFAGAGTNEVGGYPGRTSAAPPGTTTSSGAGSHLTPADPSSSSGVSRTVVDSRTESGPRPRAGATPVFTVRVEPTFYCETTSTLTPRAVVYDDGTVLVADTLGAYCDPVAQVRTGMIDLAELDRLAGAFFDSLDPTVDLSDLPVTDLPVTTVVHRPTDGVSRSVRVYGLGAEKIVAIGGITPEQEQTRKRLGDLIEAVKAPAQRGARWVPDRLVVAAGLPGGFGKPRADAEPVRQWPIPLTPAIRTAVAADRNHRSCTVIADADQVAAVLKTHGSRATAARWRDDGHDRRLAIGIVLPGFPACSG